jgi:SAM-dependent methyltransferase
VTDPAASYDQWHARHNVDDGLSTPWHQLAAALLDAKSDLGEKSVLEIGCGRGGFASWLALQGGSVSAADFSETALRIAGEHFKSPRISWVQQDIQRLTFPEATFDTVISCETVEHVPDPKIAVRELARVLKPGGILVLTCPNYLGLMGAYRGYLRLTGRRFTEEGQPINNFVLIPRVLLWLRAAGLALERLNAKGHYLPLPGRPPISLAALDKVALFKPFALHTAFRARKPEKPR